MTLGRQNQSHYLQQLQLYNFVIPPEQSGRYTSVRPAEMINSIHQTVGGEILGEKDSVCWCGLAMLIMSGVYFV